MFFKKPDAGEEFKYCSALYARVFSTLAADKKLAADEKSQGFLAPNADEKSGKQSMPTTTGRSDELPYRIRASYSSSAADRQTTTEDDSSLAQLRLSV
jgi:hypothetical protein